MLIPKTNLYNDSVRYCAGQPHTNLLSCVASSDPDGAFCVAMKKKQVDPFYLSPKWQRLRKAILARDKYTDQLELRAGRYVNADTVHHILPRDRFPQYQLSAWNLISISRETHNALHNSVTGGLSPEGEQLMMETAERNGIKLSRLTLVVGAPGSGKTTYVKHHLGAGVVYDLDYIAAAFRLAQPHTEQNKPARRMANSLLRGFAANARRFASEVYVIRTAPDIEEVVDIDPDAVIVCGGRYDVTHRKDYIRLDDSEIETKIKNIIEWAEANDIPITRVTE